MAMSCMQQQQQQPYFSPLPPTPPGCKGVGNPHHHHHQHANMIMKVLTPEHNQELGEFGVLEAPVYSEAVVNYESNRMYSHLSHANQTDIGYDVSSCYQMSSADCTNITALRKSLIGSQMVESYEDKHPAHWSQAQLLQWLHRVCEQNSLDYHKMKLDLTSLTADVLLRMNKMEFLTTFHHGGAIVFEALHKYLNELRYIEDSAAFSYNQLMDQPTLWESSETPTSVTNYNSGNNVLHMLNTVHSIPSNASALLNSNLSYETQMLGDYLLPGTQMALDNQDQIIKCEIDSDGESNQSYSTMQYSQDTTIIPLGEKERKRKPGRPPNATKKSKNGGQRNSRLWEFIRDLLLDDKTCPSLLKWENVDEGIFRFVQSDKVARLWGERKCNPRMTYEKLSRAMRYYYKSQVFQPVIGRRLVYKFGPNATGWRPRASLLS